MIIKSNGLCNYKLSVYSHILFLLSVRPSSKYLCSVSMQFSLWTLLSAHESNCLCLFKYVLCMDIAIISICQCIFQFIACNNSCYTCMLRSHLAQTRWKRGGMSRMSKRTNIAPPPKIDACKTRPPPSLTHFSHYII